MAGTHFNLHLTTEIWFFWKARFSTNPGFDSVMKLGKVCSVLGSMQIGMVEIGCVPSHWVQTLVVCPG
jgi:hypothetical protein